jgi:hypothetical protein
LPPGRPRCRGADTSAAGGLLWAAYVVGIGRVGGALGGGLLSQIAIGLLAGVLVAAALTAGTHLVRRLRSPLALAATSTAR